MKDNLFYMMATISSAMSFIQGLIPILQVVLLTISLVCTLIGLFNTIKDKLKRGEDVTPEIIEGVNKISDYASQINKIKEGEEDGRTKGQDTRQE